MGVRVWYKLKIKTTNKKLWFQQLTNGEKCQPPLRAVLVDATARLPEGK